VYEKTDRSNTGRVEEDVRIRVQMGKCSFYSTLSRIEGNKAHKVSCVQTVRKNSVLHTAGLLNSTVADTTFKMWFEILSGLTTNFWRPGCDNVQSRNKFPHTKQYYVIPIPSSLSPSTVLSYSSSLRAVDVMGLPSDPNLKLRNVE
jgi:hypothetical protein